MPLTCQMNPTLRSRTTSSREPSPRTVAGRAPLGVCLPLGRPPSAHPPSFICGKPAAGSFHSLPGGERPLHGPSYCPVPQPPTSSLNTPPRCHTITPQKLHTHLFHTLHTLSTSPFPTTCPSISSPALLAPPSLAHQSPIVLNCLDLGLHTCYSLYWKHGSSFAIPSPNC